MKKLYGLIGYPVKHSLSPAMHNAAFKHLGIDAEYKLFEVRPDELEDFFKRRFFEEGLSGINITIPHKETSMKYVTLMRKGIGSIADWIGAINTVFLEGDKLIGANTDAWGFKRSLEEDLIFDPKNKNAFIFGAGGAGRAVAFYLDLAEIARIVIVDLDMEKAASLVNDLEETGCNAMAVKNDRKAVKEMILNSDLLVNATPCGMKKDDAELLPADFLHEKLTVFDLIYNPKETPLIKEAKKRCFKVTNGLGMLLYQGAESFKLWTKREAPIDIMSTTLNNTLYH